MLSKGTSRRRVHGRVAALLMLSAGFLCFGADVPQSTANQMRLLTIVNTVEIAKAGTTNWLRAVTNAIVQVGDRLRTGERSGATVRLSDRSVLRIGELSTIELRRPAQTSGKPEINVIGGLLFILSRDKADEIQFRTRAVSGAVRGTEFHVSVDAEGQTVVTMRDGLVELSNEQGTLQLTNHTQAIVELGQAPRKTAYIEAINIIQWCLYYPGVLDPDELELTPEEKEALRSSLEAYRQGDLLRASALYSFARVAISDSEKIYRAALLLSVGQVEQAEGQLKALSAASPLADALRRVIAAVKFQTPPSTLNQQPSTLNPPPADRRAGQPSPKLAAEWLAESYYQQSQSQLEAALKAARAAVAKSPNFGFAWARVAELEFSFGRVPKALAALDKARQLSPRNAQAAALKGFLLAARNRWDEALAKFDQAIAIDGSLGNAWLGRGLVKIQRGQADEGRQDLQVAAVMEPQRAVLRSYLGKAWSNARDAEHAWRELELAKRMDDRDPTAWLYSALLNDQYNRINEGVRDLEKSQALNDNRRVYRSRLLLDQDRAVRGANLANIYADAGMTDVSVREAARAVSYDYANYSAHLFLSESFNALRDPTRFNLRAETPWFNELLLANLLAPVGGTPLSQNISQQEYSRLFDQNRLGLSSWAEYRSDGQFRELASQFGSVGNTGWALDLDYQHNDGIRPNNALDRIEWYSTIKQQLTAQDSLLLLTKYQDYHSGDNFQYFDPTNARPNFRFDEYQSPIVLGGYHHEWQPGVHTLLLAGRLENDQRFSDLNAPQAILFRDTQLDPSGPIVLADSVGLDVQHRSRLEIYAAEAQQIFENERHALLLGGRWQGGEFDTHSLMTNPSFYGADFPTPAADAHAVDGFERVSAYFYDTLKLPGRLRLTGGLAYEYLRFPANFRAPPIQSGEETRERFDPKAALVWDILPQATFRAVYAKSLGGVSLDESYRLEPTQLGGFSQAFRTLIPESLVGSVSAPDHEIWGAALDFKFKTRTYIGFRGEFLSSEVQQTVGVFDYFFAKPAAPRVFSSGTPQRLDYEERSVSLTLNQLLAEEWALGAQYSFVRSELETDYPALGQLSPSPDSINRANLHRVNLQLLYNHPSGFFAQAESQWYFQQNSASAANLPDDSFQQLNLFAGYRFHRHRGEIQLGVLNLTDQDYRLNPLNVYSELPRERTFMARLKINF